MPRTARVAPGGLIYHALNRGHGRRQLFYTDRDYAAFVERGNGDGVRFRP